MSTTSAPGAAVDIVARLRAAAPWDDLEALAEILCLDAIPGDAGSALALLDTTLVYDRSLPPDERAKQFARGCARYIVREGAACSEDELTAALLASCARARVLKRGLRAPRSSVCAV